MSPERDLNPRPLPYQGNALPAELSGRRILEQYKILLRLLIDGRMSVLQTFSGRLNIAPVQMSYSGMVPVWFRYGLGEWPEQALARCRHIIPIMKSFYCL